MGGETAAHLRKYDALPPATSTSRWTVNAAFAEHYCRAFSPDEAGLPDAPAADWVVNIRYVDRLEKAQTASGVLLTGWSCSIRSGSIPVATSSAPLSNSQVRTARTGSDPSYKYGRGSTDFGATHGQQHADETRPGVVSRVTRASPECRPLFPCRYGEIDGKTVSVWVSLGWGRQARLATCSPCSCLTRFV